MNGCGYNCLVLKGRKIKKLIFLAYLAKKTLKIVIGMEKNKIGKRLINFRPKHQTLAGMRSLSTELTNIHGIYCPSNIMEVEQTNIGKNKTKTGF
ncbi:hypothetical protein GDO78_004907 [Eleutherodactylus coqui]|uniref:Uncharacterized protein n=1 Tax=Eleutherodactylus coqui TaxID=57060 RepID=A0A8J6FIP2_ELECQ|nr:hypothetical protein GDO78_004907 [Eleutherodactylus coqui]